MSEAHNCHWLGCQRHVPPKLWGCAPHWFTLPKDIRDRIWAAYVPGQELTKAPSDAYLAVAREAHEFARSHVPAKRPSPASHQAPLF
ncbi:hypothetical protein WDL1P2_00530 (plasmid) [Variovorax sp. WDL1]|nr:hypothetical protein CHC06_06310 [Variovorax sp. B2]PNG49458.1 hypothetical protein CHC07_06367 [Variovorax sp. B4]VTV18918.1 hypothetical protein WDL1P2_00530 [Variovorax sp. WDL1]